MAWMWGILVWFGAVWGVGVVGFALLGVVVGRGTVLGSLLEKSGALDDVVALYGYVGSLRVGVVHENGIGVSVARGDVVA